MSPVIKGDPTVRLILTLAIACTLAIPVPAISQSVIESVITNDWSGWSGDTVLVLENGQVWQQAEYEYDYNYAYRPRVWIFYIGHTYKAFVEGHDEPIAVRQLR